MPINSTRFSSTPINEQGVAVDVRPKLSGSLLEFEQRIVHIGKDALLNIENEITGQGSGAYLTIQNVTGYIGSGSMMNLEQEVELRLAGGGAIASFEQTTTGTASGAVFYLSQRVRDLSVQYKPFDIDIVIGGWRVPDEYLTDAVEISRGEDEASLLSFTIRPDAGVQDLVRFQGKSIIVDVTANEDGALLNATSRAYRNGLTYRLYTGRVDVPEIDLLNGTITFNCSDNRTEILNNWAVDSLDQFGYWSDDVFSEPSSQAQEIEDRLTTIPYSVDADVYGNMKKTAWQPKTIADFSLQDKGVYRRTPSVSVLARGRVVNDIDIDLTLQYQRLRQRDRNYTFTFSGGKSYWPIYSVTGTITSSCYSNDIACFMGKYGFPPKVSMIQDAITATSWQYRNWAYSYPQGNSSFSNNYVANCCGVYVSIAFQTFSTSTDAVTNTVYDSGTGQWVEQPVYDSKGNPVYETNLTGSTDRSKQYAMSASWTMSKRFAQNVTENVKLKVKSSQSIAQYGAVSKEESASVRVDYDTKDWEDSEFGGVPKYSNGSTFPQSANGDYYTDMWAVDGGDTRWNRAVEVVYHRARTEIVKSHRDNLVSIETPFIPALNLTHTMETTGGYIRCKGKVARIKHTLDVVERDFYTEIDIKLSRSTGSQPSEPSFTTSEIRPSVTDPAYTPSTVYLKTVLLDSDEPVTDDLQGWIIKKNPQAGYGGSAIGFAVNTGAVEDDARDDKEASKVFADLDIPIRNDLLEVEFN